MEQSPERDLEYRISLWRGDISTGRKKKDGLKNGNVTNDSSFENKLDP